jgi:serine/threonine-protein kinase
VGDRESRLIDLATALADGTAVDWEAAESSAATDSERRQIRHLRVVRGVADAKAGASLGGPPGQVYESLLHPSGDTDEPATEETTPVAWGPLQVIEKVGRGRFGDVYRAFDPRLDREVALKLLRRRDGAGDPLGSAVIDEGRLLAKVRHPNIVAVYGAERIDERVGVWMELVRGRTLEDELLARGPLSAAEVVAIGRDVCAALGAVHRAGLVHRDIKAQNVMRDDDGRIVLMDFGTGREADASAAPELAGTPLYLAPEVLNGAPATPQSEIYSVGVLLYHLLTGDFPVKGRTLREILEAHVGSDRAGPRAAVARLGARLGGIVARALSPQPGDRFARAGDLADALRGLAVPRRLGLSSATAAGGLLCAAVAILVATTWNWRDPASVAGSSAPHGQQAVRRLWSGEGVSGSGAPSPDGRYLTFTDWDSGDLALHDFQTGTDIRLTQTNGWTASGDYAGASIFSRDGHQIAYSWFVESLLASEVRLLRLNAGQPAESRVLVRTTVADKIKLVAFTPDGSGLVVLRGTDSAAGHFGIISILNGSYRQIAAVGKPWPIGASLSPDGRYLAYDTPAAGIGSPRDIFLVSTGPEAAASRVSSPSNDTAPNWTPDGSGIVFLSDRTGTPSLWGTPVRSGQTAGPAKLLKADIGRVRPLGVADNGALYYYVSGATRQNVNIAHLNNLYAASAPSLATDRFVNSNSGPAWSPDGRSLAFFSYRPEPQLVLRSIATGRERDVALPAGLTAPFNASPHWFPDNASLLILCRDARGTGRTFYRFHPGDGRAEPIHHLEDTPSSFALSSNGRSIFYVYQHIGYDNPLSGRVLRYDIDSKRESILKKDEWFISLAISPDASTLAVLKSVPDETRTQSPGVIEVMAVAGGASREVFKAPKWVTGSRYNALAWTPDGRWLMFVQDDGILWRVPAEGGQARNMGISVNARIKSPAVHPDGKSIAFGTIESDNNEVWMLENFLPARPPQAERGPR